MNGKGSKDRVKRLELYRSNYDSIYWGEPAYYCLNCGVGIPKKNVRKYPNKYLTYKDGVQCLECKF